MISGIVYFREIILESSQNVSETTPWELKLEVPYYVVRFYPLFCRMASRQKIYIYIWNNL